MSPKDKAENRETRDGEPEIDLSAVYDEAAANFDSDVSFVEKTSMLWYIRRKLIKKAKGHVLEVSVGTGMNFKYYHLDACRSITFLDQSGPMLEIAKQKWKHLYPKTPYLDKSPGDTRIAFRQQSALDALDVPRGGYDTIIQPMGVCSTPVPAQLLSHLGTLLNQKTGKILLIEHGRGYYNWINYILDRDARRHAEKYGCYHNRDIGTIVEQSGLVVESIRRPFWWNLGTVWVIEARPKGSDPAAKWSYSLRSLTDNVAAWLRGR